MQEAFIDLPVFLWEAAEAPLTGCGILTIQTNLKRESEGQTRQFTSNMACLCSETWTQLKRGMLTNQTKVFGRSVGG